MAPGLHVWRSRKFCTLLFCRFHRIWSEFGNRKNLQRHLLHFRWGKIHAEYFPFHLKVMFILYCCLLSVLGLYLSKCTYLSQKMLTTIWALSKSVFSLMEIFWNIVENYENMTVARWPSVGGKRLRLAEGRVAMSFACGWFVSSPVSADAGGPRLPVSCPSQPQAQSRLRFLGAVSIDQCRS